MTPSTNTISGFVYYDANNNGVFDAGETPIANSQIILINNTNNQARGHHHHGGGRVLRVYDRQLGARPRSRTRPRKRSRWDRR